MIRHGDRVNTMTCSLIPTETGLERAQLVRSVEKRIEETNAYLSEYNEERFSKSSDAARAVFNTTILWLNRRRDMSSESECLQYEKRECWGIYQLTEFSAPVAINNPGILGRNLK